MTHSEEKTAKRALVVSIHDVSPRTEAVVRTMLEDLRQWGVDRTSLLVIPDHHEKGRTVDDATTVAWLRECEAAGHENVVHGYYHRRPVREGQGIWNSLITNHYTAGEGEFFDLSREAARELSTRGWDEFRSVGLEACGFIAPAWLLGPEAEAGVREAGFDYTVRIRELNDFRSGREFSSQSLVWSVRAAWRRIVSLGWNRLLFQEREKNAEVMRVSLHPPDWQYPAIRGQVEKIIRRALAARQPMTYHGWLVAQRDSK